MSTFRTRSTIAARLTDKPAPFEVGGVDFFLKVWTAREREAIQRECREVEFASLWERLFIAFVCDESGRTIYSNADLDMVAGFNGLVVEAVAKRAVEINGFSPNAKRPSLPGWN